MQSSEEYARMALGASMEDGHAQLLASLAIAAAIKELEGAIVACVDTMRGLRDDR